MCRGLSQAPRLGPRTIVLAISPTAENLVWRRCGHQRQCREDPEGQATRRGRGLGRGQPQLHPEVTGWQWSRESGGHTSPVLMATMG